MHMYIKGEGYELKHSKKLGNVLSALKLTCRFDFCVLDSVTCGQRSPCCWGIWHLLCWTKCKWRTLHQVRVEERSEPPTPCSASAISSSAVTTRSWISLPIWKKTSLLFWWVTLLWAQWAGSRHCTLAQPEAREVAKAYGRNRREGRTGPLFSTRACS